MGALTNLYSFTWGNDGAQPKAGLVQGSDGNFYGTTYLGGVYSSPGAGGAGTVFKISATGALTSLYSFTGTNDGANPSAGLVPGSDGNFYGTTSYGFTSNNAGTVFKISPNGVLTTLHSFTGYDGAQPHAGLVQGSDGNFYGTTYGGGMNGYGTVFQVTTNGVLADLVSFAGTNGAYPQAAPTLGSNGSLYGTTYAGGAAGLGVVFRLGGPPSILRQPQPTNRAVLAGVNVTINAKAFGSLPLSYQWLFNATNLPGATSATVTLSNVSFSESGIYALLVTNNLGSVLSSNAVLTVLPALVPTLPASGISATGAVLHGSVTLGPEETLAWFEWGADTNYGLIAGITNIPGGSGTVTFSNALSGLDGDLIYHYRVVAWNNLGIAYGADQSFQVGLKPNAVTFGGTDISTNGATLIGSVNPEGPDTTVYFRWGLSSFSLSNQTPALDLGKGVAPLNVSIPITGLTTGQVYYCQIVASNRLGTVSGATLGFPTGPWTQTPAPPIHNWDSLAASADGTKLVAVANDSGTGGPIFTSTNSGATWEPTSAPVGPWESVACSADGTQLVVAGGGGSQTLAAIYRSTNSGATWTQTTAPSNNWASVASSADGTKLVAADSLGQRIYTSADSASAWTQTSAPSNSWSCVASSADGTKLVAVSLSGWIYTSTNSGAAWISNSAPSQPWTHVSSSADGTTMVAVAGGLGASGEILTSTDSGATWALRPGPGVRSWICSATSADGTKMAAVAVSDLIYTSTNSGATWTPNNIVLNNWNAVASSADGALLVASVGYPATGGVYTSRTTPAPQLNLASAHANLLAWWIIPSLGFGLQQNSDLTSANWTEVTNPPVLNLTNLQNQVVLPLPAGNSFFRLKH